MNAVSQARDLWLQARALGDNPQGEWTYPLLMCRAVASPSDGLDQCYEHLSTWQELVALVQWVDTLDEFGIEPYHVYSVMLGLCLFDEAYYAPQGRLLLPAPAEPYRGRHAVQMAGMEDGELVFANSWGGGRWGNDGYGYISQAYFEQHVDSVLIRRPAWCGPSLALDSVLKQRSWTAGRPGTVLPSDVAATWYTPNPLHGKTTNIDGARHELTLRQLFAVDHHPLEIVEVRREGVLAGRMHVAHRGSETLVDEIWVPPSLRRRGYGSYLLEVAVERAARAASSRITLRLHEADAHVHVSHRGQAFAEANGYKFMATASIRPNISAIATKDLPGRMSDG